MSDAGSQPGTVRLTRRGAATRASLIQAAAELMYVNGVATTLLDEVLAASGTSKSQFYRHFTDKSDLVQSVICFRANELLDKQTEALARVDSIAGLRTWADRFTQRSALRRGAWGCELGSLATELSDVDELARTRIADHFQSWERLLAEAFDRMRDRGALRKDVDSTHLSVAVLTAIQGGYVLAQAAHEAGPMQAATTMAIEYVRTFAPPSKSTR